MRSEALQRMRRYVVNTAARQIEALVMSVSWRGSLMAQAMFSVGEVFATRTALAALDHNSVPPENLLARHARGDWGDTHHADQRLNQLAVERGLPVLSMYRLCDGRRVYVLTEGDRSTTTIYLPGEY